MGSDSDFINRTILGQCYREASKSPDNSTQIGAVLVSEDRENGLYVLGQTAAFNEFTDGWIVNEYNLSRPRKYALIEHAERRSLYKAARYGITTEGLIMYASWAACTECARAIAECGIFRLVRHYPPLDDATERWLESVCMGDDILKAAGVEVVDIIGWIPDAFPILRNGETFDPRGA